MSFIGIAGVVILVDLVALALAGAYALYRFLRKRDTRGFILGEELTDSGLDAAPELLGRAGVAVTPLKPFGVAEFEGRRFEVVSDGELIGAGVRVVVGEVSNGKVIVRSEGRVQV